MPFMPPPDPQREPPTRPPSYGEAIHFFHRVFPHLSGANLERLVRLALTYHDHPERYA